MKIESIDKGQRGVIDYGSQMDFTLLRICLRDAKPVACLGVLYNTAGSISLYTCENADKIIPEGEYRVTYTRSSKFSTLAPYKDKAGGLVPLINEVPNRIGIRIHVGNFADESQGCILIGAYPGSACVYKSRMAYNMLMDHVVKYDMFPMRLRIVNVDSLVRYSVEEVKTFAKYLK